MQLETKRLLIRSPQLSDLESSIKIWTDPKVRKYSGGPATIENVQKGFMEDLKLKDSDYGFRSVIEKESDIHIGDSGLIKKEIDSKPEVELMYFFNSNYWRRGFATEAALKILAYGINEVGLARIVALIHPENVASMNVAKRLEMKYEKQVTTATGNVRDLYAFNTLKKGSV